MTNAALRIEQYRRRAQEVRVIADGIRDPSCRENLIGMAENYERLAAAVEARNTREARRGTTIH